MEIAACYDINKIINDIEAAMCITGSDYGERNVDTIIESVTNRIIKEYQIDLHGIKINDTSLYVGNRRSQAVLFVENIALLHAKLSGYTAAVVRYYRDITIRPINLNYMGYSESTMKSFFMAAQMKSAEKSIATSIEALKQKFSTVNICTEKKLMLILIICYQFGFNEMVSAIAEIMYLGMKL